MRPCETFPILGLATCFAKQYTFWKYIKWETTLIVHLSLYHSLHAALYFFHHLIIMICASLCLSLPVKTCTCNRNFHLSSVTPPATPPYLHTCSHLVHLLPCSLTHLDYLNPLTDVPLLPDCFCNIPPSSGHSCSDFLIPAYFALFCLPAFHPWTSFLVTWPALWCCCSDSR